MIKMENKSFNNLNEIKNTLDNILNKRKLALVKANNFDYVVSSYKIVKNYILLYFNNDFLDAYHYLSIQEIKELMEG